MTRLVCFYCGEVATSLDHIVARVHGGGDGDTVPCCLECNSTLGAACSGDEVARLVWLYNKYVEKYKLSKPPVEWTSGELRTLKGSLQSYVKAHAATRQVAERRVGHVHTMITKMLMERERAELSGDALPATDGLEEAAKAEQRRLIKQEEAQRRHEEERAAARAARAEAERRREAEQAVAREVWETMKRRKEEEDARKAAAKKEAAAKEWEALQPLVREEEKKGKTMNHTMTPERLAQLRAIVRSGGKPKIKCPMCGERYEFKAAGRPKLYCSTRCRVRAQRERDFAKNVS